MIVQTPVAMLHGGANIEVSRRFALRPALLYTQPIGIWKQGGAAARARVFPPLGTLDVSLSAVWAGRVWAGLSYRAGVGAAAAANAIALMAQAWITPSIRIGYAYDLPLNAIRSAWGGSHEVSLGFTPVKKITRYKNARTF